MSPGTFSEPLPVPIPGDSFLMGCGRGRDEEKPPHRVWVDEFRMAVFPVRNRDYRPFLEAGGQPPPLRNDPNFDHLDQPVVAVSWFEAAKYCEWLSAVTGRDYRLPTEAEWERAARGGREGALYPWGDEAPHARPEYMKRWGGQVNSTLPVGGGVPNAWGVYELGENVHEWCSDWFDRQYYANSPARNQQGPDTGERRASRGGSWRHHIKFRRCAARSSIPPSFQYADYGFRVVCTGAAEPE